MKSALENFITPSQTPSLEQVPSSIQILHLVQRNLDRCLLNQERQFERTQELEKELQKTHADLIHTHALLSNLWKHHRQTTRQNEATNHSQDSIKELHGVGKTSPPPLMLPQAPSQRVKHDRNQFAEFAALDRGQLRDELISAEVQKCGQKTLKALTSTPPDLRMIQDPAQDFIIKKKSWSRFGNGHN